MMMMTKTSSSQIKIILFVMLINEGYTSLHFLRVGSSSLSQTRNASRSHQSREGTKTTMI
jgi:hypothetical protein